MMVPISACRKLGEVLRKLGVLRLKDLDVGIAWFKVGRSFRGFFGRIHAELGVKAEIPAKHPPPAKPVRRREEEDARVGSACTGRVGVRESSKLSSENCHAFVTSCRSPW
ncbi:uncharacterized protein LOC103931949 [Pyrus x bretschneideri]|uniref:uncharacterized protein LOC103931949 n=1 Tax=Pyrus x bretschneideri TaxID=225117 RepID=UPI00202FE3B8|nr:uncharacterized protein LOC103931949 [Pyrus x bretschneideri]